MMALSVITLLLSGCLVTSVHGDASPPLRLGELHTCHVDAFCGADLVGAFDESVCSDDTVRLENELAFACREDFALECGGFCHAECQSTRAPCFFFPDEGQR
jgi:hypothetical protein